MYGDNIGVVLKLLAFQFRKRRREDKNDGSQTNLTKPASGLSARLRRRIVEICSSARQRKAKAEMWLVQRLSFNRRAEPIVWTVSICDLTTREEEAQRVSTTRQGGKYGLSRMVERLQSSLQWKGDENMAPHWRL
jgi:hypothetical protein